MNKSPLHRLLRTLAARTLLWLAAALVVQPVPAGGCTCCGAAAGLQAPQGDVVHAALEGCCSRPVPSAPPAALHSGQEGCCCSPAGVPHGEGACRVQCGSRSQDATLTGGSPLPRSPRTAELAAPAEPPLALPGEAAPARVARGAEGAAWVGGAATCVLYCRFLL